MNKVIFGVFVAVLFSVCAYAQPAPGQTGPSTEMRQLSRLIVGKYKVVEKHHARPGAAEWVAEGTASYRPGPDGMSVFEEYQSNGPKGPFSAIAVTWWDAATGAFKHLECESREPCGIVDDSGVWEGQALVFRRQFDYQGRKVKAEEHYDLSRPDAIVITSRFSVDGGPTTTSMTITYSRM